MNTSFMHVKNSFDNFTHTIVHHHSCYYVISPIYLSMSGNY